jgi:NDP-sugar pyrophosphorylase family protein
MILAAGLGTRLRPLTWVRPKVLVPLPGAHPLRFWILRLAAEGFQTVVVNAHHLHDHLVREISAGKWPVPVHLVVETELLGTAGGIRNALNLLGEEPFLVVNGDTLSDAPLRWFHQTHMAGGTQVSMLVHDFPAFNNVEVTGQGRVAAFGTRAGTLSGGNDTAGEILAYTGIQCVAPEVFAGLPAGQPSELVPLYRGLIAEGAPPRAVVRECSPLWREIGTVAAYRGIVRELSELPEGVLSPLETGASTWVGPDARVSPRCKCRGVVMIGARSSVGAFAELEDVILWDGVSVESHARLRNCIVTDGLSVSGEHHDQILTRKECCPLPTS